MVFLKTCCVMAWRALLAVVVLSCLSACASKSEVSLRGEAAAVINRDYAGKPLSVSVRLYQLKSDQVFSRLTYESLVAGKGDQALLGGDLVGIKDFLVLPGGVIEMENLKLDEEARFLALVAFFRQPDKAYWRLLYPMERVKGKQLTFKVADCYLIALQPSNKALPDQTSPGVPTCGR